MASGFKAPRRLLPREYKPPGSDHDPPSERRIQLLGRRKMRVIRAEAGPAVDLGGSWYLVHVVHGSAPMILSDSVLFLHS